MKSSKIKKNRVKSKLHLHKKHKNQRKTHLKGGMLPTRGPQGNSAPPPLPPARSTKGNGAVVYNSKVVSAKRTSSTTPGTAVPVYSSVPSRSARQANASLQPPSWVSYESSTPQLPTGFVSYGSPTYPQPAVSSGPVYAVPLEGTGPGTYYSSGANGRQSTVVYYQPTKKGVQLTPNKMYNSANGMGSTRTPNPMYESRLPQKNMNRAGLNEHTKSQQQSRQMKSGITGQPGVYRSNRSLNNAPSLSNMMQLPSTSSGKKK